MMSKYNHPIPFKEAFRVWLRISVLSFGGPAGQIAVMHRILVDEKRWISESRFLHALNFCMLLPGPEAQQLMTYTGWLLYRTLGGIVAGTLFVLPGFFSILILSILYAAFQDTRFIQTLFFGLKPAVMAIVLEALIRISKRALKNEVMMALAASAFMAIFFFQVPFPLIILSAALMGYAGGKMKTDKFYVIKAQPGDEGALISDLTTPHIRPSFGRSLWVLIVCLPLWFVPILLLSRVLGPSHVMTQEGIFFSKAAVVTFGGAYSVLSYIAQQAVETYHWLNPGEMLDGLGMAETTPGPLIQVVQFVAYMGAYRSPVPFHPVVAGILASILTTWVTFIPCFLWIFLGAPYIELLRGHKTLGTALSSITAAVVGVILNLAVWFSIHNLFRGVREVYWGPVRLLVPQWQTIDFVSLAIAGAAFLLLFRFKWGMIRTLAACVAAGILYSLFWGH